MTDDYTNLYLNSVFGHANDFQTFLSLLFLGLGRILPIISLVPFFGARVLPHPVKVTFGLSIFAILLPQILFVTKSPLYFNTWLLFYLAKEIFIGIILGFLLSLPFIIVQSAGILIDHQRGGASLMVNDPTIQNQSSPLGTLFNYVLIYLFYSIDGPFRVIDIIAHSYDILPPDKLLSGSIFAMSSFLFQQIMGIMGHVMILSTQLAAPALIMVLMTDFFLGIANRLAPQVQITFLGMPLKSLLALLVVFFGWQLFNEEIVRQTSKALYNLYNLVSQFQASEVSFIK